MGLTQAAEGLNRTKVLPPPARWTPPAGGHWGPPTPSSLQGLQPAGRGSQIPWVQEPFLMNNRSHILISLPVWSLHIYIYETVSQSVCIYVERCVHMLSCSVVFDSLLHHELQSARLFCPWYFPGKNTGVGWHALLQRVSLTQESNLCLLHWQAVSLPLSHQESPRERGILYWYIPHW